tara:strand:- start:217 stop:657 length:441 start_codon:yes stop_codon:yes gene_type:complete
MKKILLSLTVISSLFLVSCEDEFAPENEENFENETNDSTEITDSNYYGYWDYTCKTVYDSIAVLTCDSSKQGTDTVGSGGEIDTIIFCFPLVQCYTTYEVVQKEVCDSVWIEKYGNECGTDWGTDSLGSTVIDSFPTVIIHNNIGS